MTAQTPTAIYVDARALQDPDYRFRGVGQHAASLLEALRRQRWPGKRPRLIAVTDVARDPLHEQHRLIFDEVTSRTSPGPRSGVVWFVSLSPMTHDPVWVSAFLQDQSIYRVALFYDLIPLQFPERYLKDPNLRVDYLVALAWLRKYDAFAAISAFSANELISRVNIDSRKVFVSGVAVRNSLQPPAEEEPLPRSERRWIVVSGGGDPRKNPECVIVAHARSRALAKAGLKLAVFGNYPPEMRADFRVRYVDNGGTQANLVFQSHLSDSDLHTLYRQGLVTVVPSRAEGFSIPIVESNAASTPVLASDVGAHPELAKDPAWRFDPDDPIRLQKLLETLVEDEGAWIGLQSDQRDLWRNYTVEKVGKAFVLGVLQRQPQEMPAPPILRGARPKVAVLTPLPPAPSGVADYSAVTLRPLKRVVDLHMFTPTQNAAWEDGWASLAPIEDIHHYSRRFDATISVMGNSNHHTTILDFLKNNGGSCIAHDARQIDFYFHIRGIEETVRIASLEAGRPISIEEVSGWLRNQRDLPVLFLSEIVRSADPIFVHSPTTAVIIKDLYDVAPVVLPFAQYRVMPPDICRPESRRRARQRLGLRESDIVLTTFGHLGPTKGVDALAWAVGMLHSWGIRAKLFYCGSAQEQMQSVVLDIAAQCGISDHVFTFEKDVSEESYIDFLTASDVGVQLREYFMGGLSGALNDCIAAGLPSVANEHLATAMDAPRFVRRVPDNLSPILIAEAILGVLAEGDNRRRPIEEMQAFRQKHSPETYCDTLLQALGIDVHAKVVS